MAPFPLLPTLALAAVAAQDGARPPLSRGERVLGERRCVACHPAPPEVVRRLASKEAPRLGAVGARVTPQYLRAFLLDPAGTHPATTMPDLLGALGPERAAGAAEALTHFLAGLGGPIDPSPVGVPGDTVERGRRLYHSVGCVACHGPQEEAWELDSSLADPLAGPGGLDDGPGDGSGSGVPLPSLLAPDLPLGFLASKTTVAALTEFLLDPLAVRPSGHMPDLGLARDEALDIARYLLRAQAATAGQLLAETPGLVREYFEEPFDRERPDFEALESLRREVVDRFRIDGRDRDEHFGFRFSGLVHLPETGQYTFSTTSDDGSQLWIDGRHLVDNGGLHAMSERSAGGWYEAGRHTIRVTMYEFTGGEGLEVRWEGPGIERSEIPAEALGHWGLRYQPLGGGPFRVEAGLAREGRALFTGLGCGACHTTGPENRIGDMDGLTGAPPPATPLLELGAAEPGTCLASGPGSPRPRVGLDPLDLEAVRRLLDEPQGLAAPLPPAQLVHHTLARLRCTACHRRDGVGGVPPARRDYFVAEEGAELGDEGRLPPDLTRVGAKLRSDALGAVLLEGRGVRPYMAARMPRFAADAVEPLVAAFAAVDRPHPSSLRRSGPLAPAELEAGRRLVGTEGGLGCIQCHDFAGIPSLGVRAVDLVEMYPRLRGGWFRELLLDPASVNMNTRMTRLFNGGQSPVGDVLEGDVERQIEALWAYLSLGHAMPIPAGLARGEAAYELMPRVGPDGTGEPITCGVFMAGVSPRTVVVGFPEQTHYAFDVQGSRLAKLWRGRFFNARGTWQGRAGALESPPSEDVLDLPPGPALARLDDPHGGWPPQVPTPQARGRRFDAGRRPTFVYALGDITVEETPTPRTHIGGSSVVRSFRVSSPRPVRDLWLRAFAWAEGGDRWGAQGVEAGAPMGGRGGRVYRVAGRSIRLSVEGAPEPLVVVGRGVDLLIPVELGPVRGGAGTFEARFQVEIAW